MGLSLSSACDRFEGRSRKSMKTRSSSPLVLARCSCSDRRQLHLALAGTTYEASKPPLWMRSPQSLIESPLTRFKFPLKLAEMTQTSCKEKPLSNPSLFYPQVAITYTPT